MQNSSILVNKFISSNPCLVGLPVEGKNPEEYIIGLQKNRSLVSLYDRTGVCTIRTLIKNDQNDLRTGTRAEFRPFSEALIRPNKAVKIANENGACQALPN